MEWVLPFRGRLRRYMQRALGQGVTNKKLMLVNTILDLKRVCDVMPESQVNESLLKHSVNMSKPDRQPQNFINGILREAKRILKNWDPIACTSTRASNQIPVMEQWIETVSSRATIESKVADGGAYEFFKQQGQTDYGMPERLMIRRFEVTDVDAFTYQALVPITPSDMVELTRRIIAQNDDVPLRKVVAICEPLKVRIVTVHHVSESSLWEIPAKNLQKYLSYQSWCLSGKVVCEDSFSGMDLVIKLMKSRGKNPIIVSDDASAATDSVGIKLSESICEMVFPEFLDIFRSLSLGVLQYKKGVLPGGQKFVKQTTAQLMGARWSFGFLCLIHGAVKRLFFSRFNYPKDEQFFRVNGDDGVIILDEKDVKSYFEFMNDLWTVNKLKTLVHVDVFSFNSALRRVSTGCKEIEKVRFNLVNGISKFGTPLENPCVWNNITESAKSVDHKVLWDWFLPEWRETFRYLDAHGTGNNWFLPHHLGGYGLKVDFPFKITSRQLRVLDVIEGGDPKKISRLKTKTESADRQKVHDYQHMKFHVSSATESDCSVVSVPTRVKAWKSANSRLHVPRLPKERVVLSYDEYKKYEKRLNSFLEYKGGDIKLTTFLSLLQSNTSNYEESKSKSIEIENTQNRDESEGFCRQGLEVHC